MRLDWQDRLIGAVAALGVLAFVVASASIHEIGFPLDDAWIHQTYGRNLAVHGEWAFVHGEASLASTSPLYTVLIAAGYVLRVPFFLWAFALGALALAGAGWTARRLGEALVPGVSGVGLWCGLAMVTAWHLVWAASSGMETMLFCTGGLLVVWLAWRDLPADPAAAFRHGLRLGLAGALLTLTRPEGVGLVGLSGLLVLLASRWDNRRRLVAWAAGVAVAWLAGIAPYMMLSLSLGGGLLPDTAAAKQAEHLPIHERWSLLERTARLLLPLVAGGLILLLPGLVYTLRDLVRRARADRRAVLYLLPLAWAVTDLSAYALRLPANYQHGRYVMPILPHLLLYGAAGTVAVTHAGRRRLPVRVATRSLALSAVFVILGFLFIGARQYGQDVRIINTEMVDTAHWVKQNLPPEDLLAVHDIGALGYYAPRPILDLAGLVSPEVVPVITDPDGIMRLMCEQQARYLMVLPDQRPAAADDPRLELVFTTDASFAREAGGGNMAVYRLHWPASCP